MSTKTKARLELQGQTAGQDISCRCPRWQNSNPRAPIKINIRPLSSCLNETGWNKTKSATAAKAATDGRPRSQKGRASSGAALHKAILESICIIVDATRCTGNQVIVAIQAIVNKNPKARATNGLYLRTPNIFQSPIPPRCC